MSPVSVIGPCKCHRGMRYMATMQSSMKAKRIAILLVISGKSTVRNHHCHLLSASLEIIASFDLCTENCICVHLHACVYVRRK